MLKTKPSFLCSVNWFSHSSVLLRVGDIFHPDCLFFSYRWFRLTQMRQKKRKKTTSERRGMRVESYFGHARSRFLGLLLFRVVGVKTGCAPIWSGGMSKSAFACVPARSCTWAADVPWVFLWFFCFCMLLSNISKYLVKCCRASLTQAERWWNMSSCTCTFGLAFS